MLGNEEMRAADDKKDPAPAMAGRRKRRADVVLE